VRNVAKINLDGGHAEALDVDTMTEGEVLQAARQRAGEMMQQFGFHEGIEEDEFMGFGDMVDSLFELDSTSAMAAPNPALASAQGERRPAGKSTAVATTARVVQRASRYLPAHVTVAMEEPGRQEEEMFEGFGSTDSLLEERKSSHLITTPSVRKYPVTPPTPKHTHHAHS